ncbi:uncharacterized protein LOC132611938 [Lycium barbarum]|uniref:uncharacterized protein LOC132611938 n=1 Tax=Lycium barbarum TaxID=112863 RepID=UPI00293EF2D6|nr:uncharacterized protein LOC132611938 [Lycium barbarum]
MALYQPKLNIAKQRLEVIRASMVTQPLCHQLIEQEKVIVLELEKWSIVKEQLLRQKSKELWIQCGDSNSKLFHAQWRIRTSMNTITSVYNNVGVKLTDPKLVEEEFIAFFTKLMGECISTVSYSLTLNGGLTEPFQGKRGIRQGDPISPYLFVIAMKYLQREFAQLAKNKDFHFHPRCKKLAAVHVCFAYDLLMFCRAHLGSISLLQQTFMKFSLASRLQENADKSSFYLAGTLDNLKQTILEELGYSEGTIPFKYLGVPVAAKKLSILQCWSLVERIIAKINYWFSKIFSYASRLQLIKSVLFGGQSYWAQIFLIPKKFLKMVEAICRSFLWIGDSAISKKALVS